MQSGWLTALLTDRHFPGIHTYRCICSYPQRLHVTNGLVSVSLLSILYGFLHTGWLRGVTDDPPSQEVRTIVVRDLSLCDASPQHYLQEQTLRAQQLETLKHKVENVNRKDTEVSTNLYMYCICCLPNKGNCCGRFEIFAVLSFWEETVSLL